MHSLRKYQGFIIYQTWADIESFGTDKSVPYEALINKITTNITISQKEAFLWTTEFRNF